MELIKTIREKSHTRKQMEIHRQAEETITLSDFDSILYIAYQGTPLIPINSSWTSQEIVEELTKVRQNFINSQMKLQGLSIQLM